MTLHYQNYEEYLQHPLFKLVRACVMRRAKGICEKCGAAPASEVHHVRYPTWGAFDTPSNLLAVCHVCHSKEHKKKNGHGIA